MLGEDFLGEVTLKGRKSKTVISISLKDVRNRPIAESTESVVKNDHALLIFSHQLVPTPILSAMGEES